MILRELRQVLIDVEDNGDADDQDNGKEIGTDELSDDVSVEDLDIAERVQLLDPAQTMCDRLPVLLDPLPSSNESFEMVVNPSGHLQSLSMFPDLCVLHAVYDYYRL